MSQTVIRGSQLLNNTVQRQDLDTTTAGQALVTKIVQGSGITLSSTGADSGTGDVTVTAAPGRVSSDANNLATLGSDSLIAVPASSIWSVRLRSFNAIGNPTFECDQINVGSSFVLTGGTKIDRWSTVKSGTMAATGQQIDAGAGGIVIPGTNFAITSKFLRITLTTQEASLAAGDYLVVQQIVEGPFFRALMGDVHSAQVLVRSSVAGLKFGLSIRGPVSSPTSSLTKLSPALVANTWTAVQFQNLPNFPSGWPYTPGNAAYYLAIGLAVGSTYTSPANDTFQSAQYFGALGQSNFAASAVNSTFDIAFCQHEPGSQCTTLQDKPFTQNYDECLRYFQKSMPYGTQVSAASSTGQLVYLATQVNSTSLTVYVPYVKPMAKSPALTAYSNDGTINTVRDASFGANRGVTSFSTPSEKGYSGLNITGQSSTGNPLYAWNYTADTGW
jgi:hypothetical protein